MPSLKGIAAVLILCSLATPKADKTVADFGLYQADRFPKYVDLPRWTKRIWTPAQYEAFLHDPEVEVVTVRYLSDQYYVNGFVFRPTKKDVRLPLLIWNRGGAGPDTAIGNNNFHDFYEMYSLAKAGFVVAGSQFRGTGGSEGKDEVGGAELHDIAALIKLISAEPYADSKHLYMFGFSRGAMMTLQTIASGIDVKAAVVVGAPTDWEALFKTNPRLEQLARDHWPAFQDNRLRVIEDRLALQWPEELDTPILFFVGTADEAIPPEQSMHLATRLGELGFVYELIVYANDDHFVTKSREARLDKTSAWFKQPPRKPIGHYLAQYLHLHGVDEAIAEYKRLRNSQGATEIDFSEPELNALGYNLLFIGKAREAIAMFSLNCEAYPRSDNAWESLGEAYVAGKDRPSAENAFKQALSLNPSNQDAVKQLSTLRTK